MSCCETNRQTYDWWTSMELDKDWEEGVYMQASPLASITFYKGDPPRQYLRKRWIEIVNTNPWLAGRLSKDPTSTRVVLKVPPHPPHADRLCNELGDVGIRPGMDYQELVKLCMACTQVKTGLEALEREQQLTQLAVTKAGKDHFAIILSISPVIVDGHNFYSIYHMLDPSVQLTPLDHSFVHFEAREEALQAIGVQKHAYAVDTRRSVLSQVAGLLKNDTPQKPLLRYINEDFIADQKKRHSSPSAPVPWVSTNDILTSWFVNAVHADYLTMKINWRHRMGNLTDITAGNYEGLLHYWPSEADTPQKIRRSISSPPHYGGVRPDVPTPFEELWQCQAHVSNWGNFYRDVNLPESELLNQVPIVSDSSSTGGFTMIIFKARAKQTAVYVYGRNRKLMAELANSRALGANFLPGAIGGI
mmetsp:Transcript_51/g.132  ORF Transcript_51/g.132 Transcript_51/m.132 type:complete len:418 (-) Transcript_51:8-1261(-)